MRDEIDLKGFLLIMKRRITTILLTTVCISLLCSAVIFLFLKPTYESKEFILIGNLGQQGDAYMESQNMNRLIASTVDFITSPIVLETLQDRFNLSAEELEDRITIKSKENSQIISIVIHDHDLKRSHELASLLTSTSVEKMKSSLKMENVQMLNQEAGTNPPEKVGNTWVNLLIGTVAGLLCGIGLAFIKDHWDDSIRGTEQIEEEFGLQVLGVVASTKDTLPKFYRKQHKKVGGSLNKRSEIHAKSH
ncbi:hypothetical protein LCD52_13320 [Rossellomorea vietnamensis]|uniref:YveK family protein n=1 Tax=Rossellomorea vietnamensis TaxID=218284 RepID=UPI001CCED2AA|nr:Wzz/FepE/Etk N-terminal domain-containing protein [Rossellomorea vietnamensis]MCA0149774.1 hypothetical protein [Rossellomorea vietnamensis]